MLLAGLSCGPPAKPHEICYNGIDDNGDGLIDCADPECAFLPECQSNYYGTCPRCSSACTVQRECIRPEGWVYEQPLAICRNNVCTAWDKAIQVRIELDTHTTWAGFQPPPRSVLTRFIKKAAADGSVVDCSVVAAAAPGKLPADVLQLETSDRFVLQGFDVYGLSNPQLGQGISLPLVNVSTGSDYLLYIEFWYGPRDGTTKLPTLNRAGWGCFDDPAVTTQLFPSDNCQSTTSDAGTCRTFRLLMPGPQ